MSGHSKWHNIQAKKSKTDAARSKVFTKLGRELTQAVKDGGPNPESNSKLKDVIAKCKASNVPNDNITRIINKANSDTSSYEEVMYEGYGPSGIAVIVETLTDNRNRTAGNIRHAFDKFGGNMGTSGCVSFMFDRQGVIVIEDEDEELDEETVMEDALEAGASDFLSEEAGIFEIRTEPNALGIVRDALETKKYTFAVAEVQYVPQTYTAVSSEDDQEKMQKMLDMLEEDDDVQNVWHNWEE